MQILLFTVAAIRVGLSPGHHISSSGPLYIFPYTFLCLKRGNGLHAVFVRFVLFVLISVALRQQQLSGLINLLCGRLPVRSLGAACLSSEGSLMTRLTRVLCLDGGLFPHRA